MTVMSGAELRARYPGVRSYDTAAALRLIGSDLPINLAYACVYPSREAADAFAAANLEHHGSPLLGTAGVDDGWVGVLDLRPQLAAAEEGSRRRKDAAYNFARLRDLLGRYEPSRELTMAAAALDECERLLADCKLATETPERAKAST